MRSNHFDTLGFKFSVKSITIISFITYDPLRFLIRKHEVESG